MVQWSLIFTGQTLAQLEYWCHQLCANHNVQTAGVASMNMIGPVGVAYLS